MFRLKFGFLRAAVLPAALALLATAAGAVSLPLKINFQGKLLNPATNEPQNGTFSMVFSLYNVSSGGTALYSETQGAVTVTNGVFSTQLGLSGTLSPSLFDGTTVYLGIAVGGDPEMTPRQQLVTSPYAFTAGQLVSASPIDVNAGLAVSTFTTDGSLQLQAGVSGTTGTFSGAVTASQLVLNSTATPEYVVDVSSPNGAAMLTVGGGGQFTLVSAAGSYAQNLFQEFDGIAAPLPAYPQIGAVDVMPSLVVATQQVTGSRPMFFGYPNGSTSWASLMSVGACGAFSQMCLDLGANTLTTALENVGTTLQVGGGDDNNFQNVLFLNTGDVGISTSAPQYPLDVGGAVGVQHLVGRLAAAGPTIATGAGAGTNATATIAGTDLAGLITVNTTNATPAPATNSAIVTVTFAAPYSSAPYCLFSPENAPAADTADAARTIDITTTAATLVLTSGTTALARANDTFAWFFQCVQ